MRPESGFRVAANWPNIGQKTMTSQFADMTSPSNFFEGSMFLSSSFFTG